MHLVAFFNQIGGCGKSTMAVHLACWLAARGKNLAIIDADPQAATYDWMEKVAPGILRLAPLTASEIRNDVEKYLPHLDVIVADTKPGLDPEALAIAKLATRILIPVLPARHSVRGALQAIKTIEHRGCLRGKPKDAVWAFMNRAKADGANTKLNQGRLAAMGITQASAMIYDRETFATASEHSTVTWLLPKINSGLTRWARVATQELDALFNEVLPHELTDRKGQDCGAAGGNEDTGERGTGGFNTPDDREAA